MLARPRLAAALIALLAACGAVPEDGPAAGADDKGDRGGGKVGFLEVNPRHSSAAFRGYVEKAVAMLEADPSQLARLTARSIRDGRVRIDELVDLTCWDFERARRDVTGTQLESADYPRLRQPGSEVAAAITEELDGYMWSNRIYVSRGQTTRRLAATLVHEVNHVINRSEIGYYDDLPTSAFLEEYRAFDAERRFDPEEYEGIDLVDHVITLYELDRDQIPADILEHPLSPRLLPDATAWRERQVANDPPDVDEECPGNR